MSGGCLGFLPSTVSCKKITGKQPSQWIVFSYIKVAESWKNSSTYPRYFFISPSHHQDTIALFPSTKRNTSSNKHRRSSFYLTESLEFRKPTREEDHFMSRKDAVATPAKKIWSTFSVVSCHPQKNVGTNEPNIILCLANSGRSNHGNSNGLRSETSHHFSRCRVRIKVVMLFFVALLLSWAIFNTPFRCGC